MEDLKQRLIDFARVRYDMGQTRFEDLCGLGHGTISAIKSNGPSASVIIRIAQQHLNEWIKRVCRAVGIDDAVEVTTSTGIKHTTTTKRKWELVTSHTARRTGITLLYLTGVPLQQVMLISGHKDQDSIRHYLRLTKEENVAILRDNPFFK